MKNLERLYLHLYRVDQARKGRGYMANYNLVIDFGNQTYKTFENPYYGYEGKDSIKVSKKSDIIDYENLLKNRGFTKEKIF